MLFLRRANRDDEGLVLRLRNDRSTREGSFRTSVISAEEHHEWFTRKLADPDCALLIIEEDGRPLGQLRLDRSGQLAEVSIGLDPAARGRGVGREALLLSVLEAPRLLGVSSIRALVKKGNAASLGAFKAAGFRVVADHREAFVLLHGPDNGP